MQTDNQVTGGVWPLASPAEEPEIAIQDWEIHELQLPGRAERTRHIVGLHGWHREGVVSSAITALDTATHRVTTESGRVYTLGSRTQGNLDSDYVFAAWRRANGAKDCDNITKTVKALLATQEPCDVCVFKRYVRADGSTRIAPNCTRCGGPRLLSRREHS